MPTEIFAISGLINGIFAISFGLVVIFKRRKDRINQLFFLMTVALAIWAFSYWQWLSASDTNAALFWVRLLSLGSIFIPVFYFHWVLYLLGLSVQKKYLIGALYVASFLLSVFSFSELFVKSVEPKLTFPFWPEPGILYHFYFVLLYIGIAIYFLYLLIKAYRSSTNEKRGQILYVIIGAVLGFSGGLTNFFLWYDIPIAPYGNFLVAAFPFLFGYATLRFHLFNIKVIAAELLTYAIWVFVFVRTVLSEQLREILINSSLLFLMLIFGTLLISSVRKEVRQREELELLNKRLLELDKTRKEFLSFASHQVKAPMTVVKGIASMIFDGSYGTPTKEIKEAVKKIQDSADRLISLVNDLLDMRKIEEGKMEYNFEKVEVNELVSGVIEEFKGLAKDKNLELTFKPLEEKVYIQADPQKFRQVIQNLVDNAIKYTEKGRIKVKVEKKNEEVLISVNDTGRGISPELLPDLFTPFSRDKKATSGGTGLGLYISKKIVEDHNGNIWAESTGEGKGSAFYAQVPSI